ncbi:MAG: hypothetical protein IJD31_05710 [Lachnospiraceae bacterium]|nr:hypothetical protein [Lachnospiraceae bacterium]
MRHKNKVTEYALPIGGISVIVALLYFLHYKIPFMMDDIWYATNLATEQPLESFSDVVESQVWHFLHWGGRNITHGILQLTLMAGDTAANIINVLMTMLLGWIICWVANARKPLWFLASLSLIIACNPNIQMSMLWQAGCANYVYSTSWILFFLWLYLRETTETEIKKLPLITFWIIPLGLITGWSNENMGPASFCIALAIIVYLWKFRKKRIPAWMFIGTAFALIGSCFAILAPGNFARSSALPEIGFLQSLPERFMNMFRAGLDFLYPSLFLLAIVMMAYICFFKKKLQPFQWFLLAHGILSYGAMFLSPHYPDRATFGTMCTNIVLIISMLSPLSKENASLLKYINITATTIALYAVFMLVALLNIL